MEKERLDILRTLTLCIAVTDMTYSHVSLKFRYLIFIEDLCHETITSETMKLTFRIHTYDTASLLASMLKGMKAIVSKIGRIRNSIYTENTTLMMQTALAILIYIITLTHSSFNICSPANRGFCYSALKYATALSKSGCSRPSSIMFLNRLPS